MQKRVCLKREAKQMQVPYGLPLCAALCLLQSPAGAQVDAQVDEATTKRAAHRVEREWLEYEIGRFSSGRLPVFAGDVKVTQRDRQEITVVEGSALATLSPDSPHTLTIMFPDPQRWLRLTQHPDRPDATDVTRLRALHANSGVSASCADCIAPFADLAGEALFLRLAAEGELLDTRRSRFVIEVAGDLRRIPPRALRLDQLLQLSPDMATWRRRPDAPLRRRGGEAIRDVAAVLRQRAPAPGGDTVRFTCTHETRYTARHFVDLDDLTRFGVRDMTLGDTETCCVDHDRHDGSPVCNGENAQ
jgi:hypothetical protein